MFKSKLSIISILLLILYIGLSLFLSAIAGYQLDKIALTLAVIYIFNLAFTISLLLQKKPQSKITNITHLTNLMPFLMALIFLLLFYLQSFIPQIWNLAGDKTFFVILLMMIICLIFSATTSSILLIIATFKNR